MSDVLDLAGELIRRASVTPDDAGCQALIAQRLGRAGYRCESLRFEDVDNLVAARGDAAPALLFLGHTDVVPTGPRAAWSSDPFEPTLRDGALYGRGAADMKGAVAAMTVALERLAREGIDGAGILLTSDEEGEAKHGVRRVAQVLRERGEVPRWCVVGEPSSKHRLGDVVRVGRRGSLHGVLTVRGVQGHVAYPDAAVNPIHTLAPALAELAQRGWDDGGEHFPPTSFQVSNIASGTGAANVIPGVLEARFNFRFGTASTPDGLRDAVEQTLRRHGVDFSIAWDLSGEPFLTPRGALVDAVLAAVREICGVEPKPDTGGGTSDGRFIAPLGTEVVELGVVNATIHKVDEHVRIDDLERLADLYEAIARRLLAQRG